MVFGALEEVFSPRPAWTLKPRGSLKRLRSFSAQPPSGRERTRMEPPRHPTAFESQPGEELPALPYSDWLIATVSSFRLGNCSADHLMSLASAAGSCGRRLLNKTAAALLSGVAASRFGSWCLGRKALRSFSRCPEKVRGAQGIPRLPRPAPCPGCSRGERAEGVGREADGPALSSMSMRSLGAACIPSAGRL